MKKILILLACLLPMLKGMAYDFKVNDIYYRIFAAETGIEAEVTYNNDNYNSYSGEVVIPGNITHGEKSYKVTSIGYYAFKNCINLTSVIIGENITNFISMIYSLAVQLLKKLLYQIIILNIYLLMVSYLIRIRLN